MTQRPLILSNAQELIRLLPSDIVCIEAEGNYSTLYLSDGEKRVVVLQLGMIEDRINNQLHENDVACFVRVGKSVIINIMYLYYIQPKKQMLMMRLHNGVQHSLSASHAALSMLKEALENESNEYEKIK